MYAIALSALQVASVCVWAAAIAKGLGDVVVGLRAKRLAKVAVHGEPSERLATLHAISAVREFDDVEVVEASGLIRTSIAALTPAERRQIERGLDQNDRTGQRRFVRELILAE